MSKKYRLLKEQFGIPAGTEFEFNGDGYSTIRPYYCYLSDECVENTPDLFEPVVERWHPACDEKYWHVDVWLTPASMFNNASTDKMRIDAGNCFQTQEQAEEAAKRIRNVLMEYHAELAEGGAAMSIYGEGKSLKYIHIIEEPDYGWYLSIGNAAPWMNRIQIKIPKRLAQLIMRAK